MDVPMADITTGDAVNNPSNTSYYLGNLLTAGTNTIQIKVTSTLLNRIRVENQMYESLPKGTYGLTEAVLEF